MQSFWQRAVLATFFEAVKVVNLLGIIITPVINRFAAEKKASITEQIHNNKCVC